MELNQYLNMFIEESKEHLQSLNENLLLLESDPQNIAIVQSIFRSAHTLKGMSATMGYTDIASLTHEMENVLDLVRNQKIKMDPFIFDCTFKSIDSLESMVQDIINGGKGKSDVSSIVHSLKIIVTGEYKDNTKPITQSMEAYTSHLEVDQFQYSVLEQSMELGHEVVYIEVAVREDCVLKAARAYMVFDVLEKNGEIIKSSPSIDDIEKEKFDRSFSVFLIAQTKLSDLEAAILRVSEIDTVKIILLDNESLKIMARKGGVKEARITLAKGASEGAATTFSDVPNQTGLLLDKMEKKPTTTSVGPVSGRTIRVDIERLDVLMNLFSELLIDRVRLEQLAGEIHRNDLTETVEHMTRVSSDLQNIVLKLRMVAVDSVFNRFPRMIRDLAKNLGKKVDLIITGADTELDRTVIDEIGDPLVHLLRNALDHGIETTSERLAVGKSEIGTIHLRAYHSGNHVFIEIEEDGKGINREKIVSTAVKNGVISKERSLSMSDDEVNQLLFASGFSTADKISDISGRGVGLDVVKTKIQSLGGHVVIESKFGKGTKFSVQLPLTLSIISAMLVRSVGEKYAIPLTSIVETAIIPTKSIRKISGTLMIDYRQGVIPYIALGKLFEVPHYSDPLENDVEVVIIRKGDKMAALMVDEFIGQQEIVLKTLVGYFNKIFAISGATILGDGQVALIIDPNSIIK